MPNRRLTDGERLGLNELLEKVRQGLLALASDDRRLLFALRRRLYVPRSVFERLQAEISDLRSLGEVARRIAHFRGRDWYGPAYPPF